MAMPMPMPTWLREEPLTKPVFRAQHAERRPLVYLCLVLAVLQLFDLHSTLRAAGGGRSETNPFVLLAIARFGFTPAVILFKVVALAIIGAYYRVVSRFDRTLWPSVSLLPVCATYLAIVLNNYS